MSVCRRDNLLGLYHDGELDSSRVAEIEEHVRACPRCAAHLADLRGISDRLSRISLAEISPIEQVRIKRFVRRATIQMTDKTVLRIAMGLAAVAAVVLVVTSVWLADTMKAPTTALAPLMGTAPAADWNTVAVTLQSDSRLPEWMVQSLGGGTP